MDLLAGDNDHMDLKVLNRVDSPRDLSALSADEKERLADEIRSELLRTVSSTGGHLASNLGVVELTIALYSVFSDNANIVWDVGHQSYVHKMLTGRKNEMNTIRTTGGLSGFPKRAESKYDCFDTGHSSTSVSAAIGFAAANRMLGDSKYTTIAVIGDGALTGGMAYEALNHLGHTKENVKIIFNDNEMSISKNVGGFINSLRASTGYTKIKKSAKNILAGIPLIGVPLSRGISSVKKAFRTFFIGSGQMFEEFGIKYLGRVDGHNISKLERAFEKLRDYEGPAVLHVRTVKGKGYAPAEREPALYHGVGRFDPLVGVVKPQSEIRDFSSAFGMKLSDMASERGNIVAISAAMIDGTGLAPFEKKFPGRIFDVGIAEQHAVTLAAGMALGGLKPFVAIYSTFLQRAYDQVLHDVCIQRAPVVLCIDRAGLVGADGETHQGIFDISYLSHIPGILIYSVATYEQLYDAMEAAYAADVPVAIRYPRGPEIALRCICEKIGRPLDKPVITRRTAHRSAIITTGRAAAVADKAADILSSRHHIDIEVLCIVQIQPFSDSVSKYIADLDRIFTIEDHIIKGGFGDLVESASARGAVVKKNGFDNFVTHGNVEDLYELYGLSADKIAAEIASILNTGGVNGAE